MSIFARFQAINDNDKASVVRKVMQNSTPNFDFFYFTALSTLMATFGLLENSVAIVIGSMLIAPVLYPILGLSLGLVMSDISVWRRSFGTLVKALLIGLSFSFSAAILFSESTEAGSEILLRTETTIVSFMIAVVAGLAVTYALAQPEWSETLPGVAISVALIPPLATVGIGLAWFNIEIITGSSLLLAFNIFGIVSAAIISFSLMNLGQKKNIAESTIKRETERMKEEKDAIQEIENGSKRNANA
jgi:uncharacterized hydrophobic protein (TIGR00271 family)